MTAGQRVAFQINVTDETTKGGIRHFLQDPLPLGVADTRDILGWSSGYFDWTPPRGIHPIKLGVWDGHSGSNKNADYRFTITVNGPVLAAIPTGITIREHERYTFDAGFVDGVSGHTFGLQDAPAGAAINPATGAFRWTPSEAHGGDSHTFAVTAMDGSGAKVDEHPVTITVREVNDMAPVFVDPIEDFTVSPGQRIAFQVNAADIDTDGTGLRYTTGPLPPGVGNTRDILGRSTGYFDWTPDESQRGFYRMSLNLWDGFDGRAHQYFTIMVNGPVLAGFPTGITIREHEEYTFDADLAGGVDMPGRTFGLEGAPAGAAIDPATGRFSWTPSEEQGGSSERDDGQIHTFAVAAMDGSGAKVDSQNVTIRVKEVGQWPVLVDTIEDITVSAGQRIHFQINAIDTDIDKNGLQYILLDPLPPGVDGGQILNRTTGYFDWTPDESQTGTHTIYLRIWDGLREVVEFGGTFIVLGKYYYTHHNFTITVNGPVLEAVPARITISEHEKYTFDAGFVGGVSGHTFGLQDAPAGAVINPATGRFSWMPSEEQGGQDHTFVVTAMDGSGAKVGEQSVMITVTEVNDMLPVIEPIENRTVFAGQRVSFQVDATDTDTDEHGLRHLLAGLLPSGVDGGRILNRTTGYFEWTPDADQWGIHPIRLRVEDGLGGRTEYNLTIAVNDLQIVPHMTIPEHELHTFNASIVGGAGVLGHTFGLAGGPGGASIDPATGVFSWEPSEEHGGNDYDFTVTAADGSGATVDSQSTTIMVTEVNLPPAVEPIGNITVSAGERIDFQINANDTDTGGDGLGYLLVGALPPGVGAGADILDQSTGYFDWTPGNNQRGVHTFNLGVEDGLGGRADQSFVITVGGPVLAGFPTDITIREHEEYTFDADFVAGISGHTFGLDGAPAGAEIDPATGVFSWEPSEEQGGNSYDFTVTAADGSGAKADEQAVTITVTEYNPPPVVEPIGNITIFAGEAAIFDVNASDTEAIGSLRYTVIPPLPQGVEDSADILDRSTGRFEWTPEYDPMGGVHTVHLRVWDGQGGSGGNTDQSFNITVQANPPPVVEAIENRTISAGQRISFYINATDEGTLDGLRYILREPLPPGVADGSDILDRETGHFDWTPDGGQRGAHTINLRVWDRQPGDNGRTHLSFVITVGGPVLAGFPTDITIREHEEYVLDLDFAEGVSGHTFDLEGAPAGAAIDPATGVFSWEPSEEQGGNSYDFTVTAADGSGAKADEQAVTITVTEYNPPPDVDPIGDIAVFAGQNVSFDVNASDTETISGLRYLLVDPLPPGVGYGGDILDRTTGRFSWTPPGEDVYTVNLRVWDGQSDTGGNADQSFNITVQANPPPVVEAIENRTVYAGLTVSFDVNASDTETIGSLRYLLVDPLPPGVGSSGEILDENTGRFEWTPDENQIGTHPIRLRVWDGQPEPDGRTDQIFNITVQANPPPVIGPIEDIDVSEGQTVAFNVTANDTATIGGLRYLLVDPLPPGVGSSGEILDENTGRFEWTPSTGQRGVHTINLRVWDGQPRELGQSHLTFTITVHGTTLKVILDRTIREHELHTFNAGLVDGADASSHTFGLTGEPDGASINSTTGAFSWTPSEEQGGASHTFTVTVANSSGATVDRQNVTVTVTEYNPPPVIEPIGDFVVNIGQTVSFNVSATDIQTVKPLLYFLDFYLPLGVGGGPEILNSSTGYFEWTPNENHTGTHVFYLHVSDGQPMDRGVTRQEFRIAVNSHILAAVPVDIRIPEHKGYIHNFDFVDGISNHTFGLREQPAGATINATTGIFVWTPAERRNSAYNFKLVALNGSGDIVDEQNLRFHIVRAGDASITGTGALISFGAIEPQSADEGGTIRYQIPLDNPAGLDVTWSISSGQTGNAAVNGSGFFTWATTESDGSETAYEFGINATTHGIPVIGTLSVEVNEINQNPVFDDIEADQNTTIGEPFSLDLDATDADEPPQNVTYRIVSQNPSDNPAVINGTTGIITWTPTTIENRTVTVRASDDHAPNGTADITITVTVYPLVTVTPAPAQNGVTLAVTPFTAGGITGRVTHPNGTVVHEFDPVTPNATGVPTTFVVSDGLEPGTTYRYQFARSSDTSYAGVDVVSGSFVTLVSGPAPIELGTTETQQASEGVELDYPIPAENPDGQAVTWEITSERRGATITDDGRFVWTPGESDGGEVRGFDFTAAAATNKVNGTLLVAVSETNQNPVFDVPDVPPATAGEPFTLDLDARDGDIPEQVISYRIVSQNPSENPAAINGTTGLITWAPAVAGTKSITVQASDDHAPNGTASLTVAVTVTDAPSANTNTTTPVNMTTPANMTTSAPTPPPTPPPAPQPAPEPEPPSTPEPTPQPMPEPTPPSTPPPSDTQPAVPVDDRTVTAPVSNTTITGMLEAYISRGLVAFSGGPAPWLDAARDGTSAGFLIAGILVNGAYTGMPGDLTVPDDITVFVNEAGNVPPVLSPVGNYTINARDTLVFAVSATDFNDTVSYRLAGAPAGAEISEQGEFSWTPGSADVGGHTFMITAHDRHNATDTESVAVTVLQAGTANQPPDAPDVTATVAPSGRLLIIPAVSDPDGDPVRITGAAGDAGGIVTFGPDRIWYVAGQAPGTETVTYNIADGRGGVDTGTITITIR